MALALGEKQAFDRHAAQEREVHDVAIFDAVAETSAGRDDGVGETERADLDGEICHVNIPNSSVIHSHAPQRHEDTENILVSYLCVAVALWLVSTSLVPDDLISGEDRSADARPDVVVAFRAVAHGNHAAVAAAKAASHHAFHGHLR